MILTIATQKGGAGKTTTAAAIAQAASSIGKKVLVVDLDSQGNLSQISGNPDASQGNSYDLLTSTPRHAHEFVQGTALGYDIVPAVWGLATLKSSTGSARRLQKCLEPLRNGYDLIIVDTPPAPGELQYNGLFAADRVIIPTEADPAGIQGFYRALDTARQIQQAGSGLELHGLLVTRYDGRPKFNQAMRNAAKREAERANVPYLGEIRAGSKVKEAQGLQVNLYDYAPKCKPAADYMRITEQLFD